VNNARKLFLTVAAMLAAGCVDNVVAPRALSVVDSTIPGGGATAALTQTDTLRFSFFIDPKKELIIIMMIQVPSPANSYYRRAVRYLAYQALTSFD